MKKILQKSTRWLDLFSCVVKISPGLFFAEYLVSGIYGISLAFTPLCMERIFGAIAKLARQEILPIQMLSPILILLGVNIISEISAGISDYLGETYSNLAGQKLYSEVNKKIGTLPAIDFENTDTLNLINKSYEGAYYVRGMVHTVMDLLTMYIPYIVIYAWYLYRCRPILPVALIMIFAPTNGSITYDASVLSAYEIRSVTSQLFQKYSRYRMTVEENVTISTKQTHHRSEIISALETAHIDPNWFADGLDTNLGREFGGTELSGGQWQRVALARAVYRPCQVIVFDEPTAAIDPNNEAELYHSFAESSADKFGFIITHRLGIVQLCQKVLVLKDGQFIDFGSHEDVLSRSEYYQQLWTAQAEQYMSE